MSIPPHLLRDAHHHSITQTGELLSRINQNLGPDPDLLIAAAYGGFIASISAIHAATCIKANDKTLPVELVITAWLELTIPQAIRDIEAATKLNEANNDQ